MKWKILIEKLCIKLIPKPINQANFIQQKKQRMKEPNKIQNI